MTEIKSLISQAENATLDAAQTFRLAELVFLDASDPARGFNDIERNTLLAIAILMRESRESEVLMKALQDDLALLVDSIDVALFADSARRMDNDAYYVPARQTWATLVLRIEEIESLQRRFDTILRDIRAKTPKGPAGRG